MGRTKGATNTQKTLLQALHDGWLLRYVETHGWCLFQPGRERPFARVKDRTVEAMTDAGWLTTGLAHKGLGCRPAKDLTTEGRRYAQRLVDDEWADSLQWDPFDHTRQVDGGQRRKAA